MPDRALSAAWILAAVLGAACDRDGDGTVPTDGIAPTAETGTTSTGPTPTEPPTAPPLELCLNEFMPENVASWADDTGAHPDWIELHNPGAAAVDLLGWALTDDRGDRRRHVFTESLILPAGGFLVLAADGMPELGPRHLSFALDAAGEEVALFREDGSAEIVTFGAVVGDLAVARDTDCGPIDGWHHVFAGSPGEPNPPP